MSGRPRGGRATRPGPLRLALVAALVVTCGVAVGALGAGPVGAAGAGLVAAYGFDEGAGTTAGDASGGGHAGTLTGAAWSAAGRFGGALSFNGTSSWVTVPDAAALDLTSAMTLEAWVRPVAGSGWRTVLMKERPGGLAYSLYGYDNSNRPPAVYGNFGGTDVSAAGGSALPVNTWSHLAGTYDGATLRLYVNGVQVATKARTGPLPASTSPLRIGGNSAWGEYFSGLIDEVRVYNRALPAAEIGTDMTTPVAPSGPDTTPPVITAVGTSGLSPAGATVTWSTDEAADSQVEYGSTASYGSSTPLAVTPVTAHQVVLSGLTAATGYHYRVRSADAAGNVTLSADGTFSTPAPDSTPPTVAVSSPAAGATVSGTLPVTATAGDNVAVAAVQFLLDGANLGAEDTTAPFSVSWDTAAAGPGAHTLTARARDTSGNLATSGPVAVTVDNSDPRSRVGEWSAVHTMSDIAQQTVLLPGSGKVLYYKDGDNAAVLDPVTGAITGVPLLRDDLFCAGQGILPDGTLLINGGQASTAQGGYGIVDNNFFNPVTQAWSTAPSMHYRRWYPTMTPLADGRQLTTSGSQQTLTDIARIPEVYDPVARTWTALPSAEAPIPYYPFMYVLPNGKIAQVGATEEATDTKVLDPATWTWTVTDPRVIDAGSSAMYAPGKILKAGTSSDGNTPVRPSSAAAYAIDMTTAAPAWRQVASMAYPRAFLNLTVLPDGTVLATGGESTADGVNAANAVKAAEVWSPATETWTTLASMQRPRLYHSIGMLLPDGRVLVSGGGNDGAVPNEPNYEIFSPPYLFKGARPTITSAPSTIQYASDFSVATPDAADIASVRLIRPASVTHGFDENAQSIELPFTRTAGGLTVTAPANANLAVPGNYLLFLVNSKGVPAVAPFTRLPAPWEDRQAPTAPASLTATGTVGAATLSWPAATDNLSVTGYRVYRSTASGFTPAAGNQVGAPTGTSYVDSGLAAGTYYYRVSAVDGAGNIGPPSPEASATATADTTAPSVAVIAPAAGATVAGTVAVTAGASDDVAVAGVQLFRDGVALGAEITAAPYTASWNTNLVGNGSHTLTAQARDTSGNLRTSGSVTVTVANAGPAGLIAAYGFNEGTGSTVTDASGGGNNGTLTGTSWSTTGRSGGALSFNGTAGWVTVADTAALHLTTGMTVEAWVRPASTSGWRSVLTKERTGGLSYALYGYANSGKPPAVYGNTGGSDSGASAGPALPLNAWSHLAGTYDGSTLRLYVNGVQVATQALTGSLLASTAPLRIGGNSVWGEYFSGLIDEVRVYNRALSPAEIQSDLATAI
ncbi:MAG TPA: LamG-like jellyroll fold domain-containing protein [Mycobacteriales bacterium]|nr:LamG-like jellyroll fold domain-containing protein [Mycobacteriales bacterium]